MAITQQKFREIVFAILYSKDLSAEAPEAMVPILMKEFTVTRKSVRQAQARAESVMAHQPELDVKIALASQSYQFDRIQLVERSVLRLATYEMLFDDEVPEKVAISEAIRLTRKFGTPEGANFVNAILDAILHEGQVSKTDPAVVEKEESEAVERRVSEEVEGNGKNGESDN